LPAGHKLRCPDVGDVLSVAIEYFSLHQITSSLADLHESCSLADLHESCENPAVPWGEGMEKRIETALSGRSS
jgi:hypothetical protein